jgi:hypothetical protein
MRFGRNLKEIDKILAAQFPDSEAVVESQRVDRHSQRGRFPSTTITVTIILVPKRKKPSLIQRIKSYFK